MKFTSSILASVLALGLSTGVQAASLGNVWLLGDSVTQGKGLTVMEDPNNLGSYIPNPDIPAEWGYRYELWQQLNANGDSFDFISAVTPPSGSGFNEDNRYYGNSGSSTPVSGFDINHEGRAGWSTSDVLNNADSSNGNINHWLGNSTAAGFSAIDTPDTTFIYLGLNDIISLNDGGGNAHGGASDIVSRLNTIISLIDDANGTDGQIFVGTLYDYDFSSYASAGRNAAEQEALVTSVNALLNDGTTLDSSATLVDLTTGFDWNTFTNDGLHPDETGAQFIAGQFYDAATAVAPAAVPVPAAVWLFGSALLGLLGTRRKA